MRDRHTEPWCPTAAYLYTLHLDGPALAWEYLRRHPDYRRDWLRRSRDDMARNWGLRLLEDPDLDARDAHPVWCPEHEGAVQIYPDDDPPPDAIGFDFWRLAGRKQLIHDGLRLRLQAHWPGSFLRLALAPDLADGMPYTYAMRARTLPDARYRLFANELEKLSLPAEGTPAAKAARRPSATSLLELHSLQALDATLSGASLRMIAAALVGADVVAQDWQADGALRARIRRLVRRGRALMCGGYRGLALLPQIEQGRSALPAQRP